MATFRNALEAEIRSTTQSSASDSTLAGYTVALFDSSGNLVDKQPISKLESIIYNYLSTGTVASNFAKALETTSKAFKYDQTSVDNFINDAFYVVSVASGYTNMPFSTSTFLLEVHVAYAQVTQSDDSYARVVQKAFCITGTDTGKIKTRVKTGSGWTEWREL